MNAEGRSPVSNAATVPHGAAYRMTVQADGLAAVVTELRSESTHRIPTLQHPSQAARFAEAAQATTSPTLRRPGWA
jgi:hypothetical protein